MTVRKAFIGFLSGPYRDNLSLKVLGHTLHTQFCSVILVYDIHENCLQAETSFRV